MKVHELKILPEYYKAQKAGKKNFEIRKNDRDYKVGDKLVLKEYDPKDIYEYPDKIGIKPNEISKFGFNLQANIQGKELN